MAAFSNAVRGDEDALAWLFNHEFGVLGVLSNAIDGDPEAVLWVERSQDEFLLHFSRACRQNKDSIEWFRQKDLKIFIAMIDEIIKVLETQIKDHMFPYRKGRW